LDERNINTSNQWKPQLHALSGADSIELVASRLHGLKW
jgi:hypothetical protein